MNKIIIFVAMTVLLFSFAGCDSENPRKKTDNNSITVYVDNETGVNYYVYCGGYSGGMTIRVNADGSPYVSEVE